MLLFLNVMLVLDLDDEDLKIGKEGFAVVVVLVIEELPKLLVKDVDE